MILTEQVPIVCLYQKPTDSMLLEPGYGKTMVFTEFYSVHSSIVISFPQENSETYKLNRAYSDSYY